MSKAELIYNNPTNRDAERVAVSLPKVELHLLKSQHPDESIEQGLVALIHEYADKEVT